MLAQVAYVGARGFDCLAHVTPAVAVEMKGRGFDYCVRYLGSVTPEELKGILAAGLAFMPVTFGGSFSGPDAAAYCKGLGLPAGVTVWLDVEGWKSAADVAELTSKINAWAAAIKAAGYDAGIYVGAGSLLDSHELYALPVDRYWHSLSRVVDRFNNLAEPECGWCQYQLVDTEPMAADGKPYPIPIDINVIQKDYRLRLPTWARGQPSPGMWRFG